MRGMKKSGEECFGGFLVKEDLLLLASKTQSLSWLNTSQPAIGSIKKMTKPTTNHTINHAGL